MGCCSGRQAPAASDMEPKPHGADGTTNGLVNANANASPNGTTNGTASTGTSTSAPAASSSSAAAAAGAADSKEAKDAGAGAGAGDAPKPSRKSRSSSILKREHDKVWNEYFTDAISVTDVAAELTGTKPAAPAPAPAAPADDAAARAARLAAARKSMIDIVGREQVSMKSTLNSRLGAIFDSYDKNNSGDMDEPELRHVLEDYLQESKAQMSKLSESLFAADGELRKVLATTGKSEAEQATELAAMKQQFSAKMQEKLSRLDAVRTASSEFAKQLLADLDRNQDGHVSRGEFMSAFQDKVEAIVDA